MASSPQLQSVWSERQRDLPGELLNGPNLARHLDRLRDVEPVVMATYSDMEEEQIALTS